MNRLLWYPPAKVPDIKERMISRGKYKHGFPEGAVFHFSAGASAESAYKWGRLNGFLFFTIAKSGQVIQGFPLDEFGYHCAPSSHPTLGDKLNSKLVGIEMDCYGKLDKKGNKYYTWFNKEVPESNVRYSDNNDNIERGWYEKLTIEQEIALKALIFWMKRQAPDIFDFNYVVSHDQIAPDRKNDIGASLSMTISEYRQFLKDSYE